MDAAVIAAALAVLAFFLNQRLASLERSRRECADALAEALAWLELPYRIRRRTDDEPETLAGLAERIHHLQERLAFHESWLQVEVPGAYEPYRALVDGIRDGSRDALKQSWEEAPKTEAKDMNIGDVPAPDVRGLREVFCEAARRELAVWRIWR
jgi:hypothetical protein